MHVIGSLEDGGAEAVLYNLIRETPHVQHIVVPLMARGKYLELLRKEGVELRLLNLGARVFSIISTVRQLRLLMDEAQPSVVQTWMYHAALISRLAKRRGSNANLFLGIHNTAVSLEHNKTATYICIKLLNKLHAGFSRIIYCSRSARDRHEEIGYPHHKGTVITNGICTETFQPCMESRRAMRKALGVDQSTHVFGMVARVHPQKNHEALIRAAEILQRETRRPFKIMLVGRGTDYDGALQLLISEFGLGGVVTALGPRDDIPSIMSAIDTLVLPSAFGEAFPMVLCEAMSCGTPCIATDVGDSASIIGDTGDIVAPGDVEALFRAMLKRLQLPLHSDGYDQRARERAMDNFSITAMASAYEAAWSI